MTKIRLPKAQRGKAWRAMIEIGPVTLIADDPIYEVLPAHLELLTARGFDFEIIQIGQVAKGNVAMVTVTTNADDNDVVSRARA